MEYVKDDFPLRDSEHSQGPIIHFVFFGINI